MPVNIRTYKNSILASVIALLASIIDALLKLLGLACIVGLCSEKGFIVGLLLGFICLVICILIGTFIKWIIFKL